MSRLSRKALFLGAAKLFALRSTCLRGQNGCVIVSDRRIISTGYNGPPAGDEHCSDKVCDLTQGCKRSIHAEANAVYFAAQKGVKLQGAQAYCTSAPCIKCAEALYAAGIVEVYYLTEYRDNEGLDFLMTHGIKTEKVPLSVNLAIHDVED